MSNSKEEFIPALRFKMLTPFFDLVQRWFVHDVVYKRLLLEQANLQPGQRVMDMGCGTGTLAIMAKQAQPAAEVCGLDVDPQMLKVAIAKANEQAIRAQFDEGTTVHMPYPDGSIDVVLSSLMIHHLKTPDKERTAREIYRVLRKPDPASSGKAGGQLHVIDFGKPFTLYGKLLKPFLHEFEEVNDNVDGRLPEILEQAGLQVREVGRFPTFFGDLAFLHGVKS